ncbi:MAG TPA: hypothetical protein VHP31_07165 [Caproicibacter sp.]|nr:hypothetical protein [Caproicibacter sp.]
MKAKLTSRKFWLALAAFIVGVLALFGVNSDLTQQISGVIISLGAVIAYIVGEGLVDTAAVGQTISAPNQPENKTNLACKSGDSGRLICDNLSLDEIDRAIAALQTVRKIKATECTSPESIKRQE